MSTRAGLAEVDEPDLGGKEKNQHGGKKLRVRGGRQNRRRGQERPRRVPGPTQMVVGTARLSRVSSRSPPPPARKSIPTSPAGCRGLPNPVTGRYSGKAYRDGEVHTNGIESFWAVLKRGTPTSRLDTLDRIARVLHHGAAKRLRVADLMVT